MKRRYALIILCSLSNIVLADSFRCKSRVVLVGESTAEVIAKCGEPMMREELGYKNVTTGYTKVEQLTFHMGKGKFLKILEFQNGQLKKIKNGARQ